MKVTDIHPPEPREACKSLESVTVITTAKASGAPEDFQIMIRAGTNVRIVDVTQGQGQMVIGFKLSKE